MSEFNTRNALNEQLESLTITGLLPDSISYENDKFDPKGKELWIAPFLIPSSAESLGKTLASSDAERGIYQVSVFCAINNGTYDNVILIAIDDIKAGFRNTTSVSSGGQLVSILQSTVNNGSERESWFKRDISINYLTFSER